MVVTTWGNSDSDMLAWQGQDFWLGFRTEPEEGQELALGGCLSACAESIWHCNMGKYIETTFALKQTAAGCRDPLVCNSFRPSEPQCAS